MLFLRLIEVNGLSDMGVRIVARRRHSRAPIQTVTVAWWRKSGDEFRNAVQERNGSKLGRMARLKKTVEAIRAVEPVLCDDGITSETPVRLPV